MRNWTPIRSLESATFQLLNARVPETLLEMQGVKPASDDEGLALVNLRIDDGIISEMTQGGLPQGMPTFDLDGGQVWPTQVDIHTHLDKGHIWPRARNPDGTHPSASRTVGIDRQANWTYDDVRKRFEFGLKCSYAHGTSAIRTHIDSHEPAQREISWRVFREARDEWHGRIDLQAVLMVMMDGYGRPEIREAVRTVADAGGVLGGVVKIRTPLGLDVDELDYCLDRLMSIANDHGLDVDLHVDETLDPAAMGLRKVALAAIRNRFRGKLVCGHCCNLSVQPPEVAGETIALCREAGIAIVTLPMVNMYLQDRRDGRTPLLRGVAPVHELAAAGLTVAAASDNCRDPFFAFGDHDLVEVYREFVRIAHLDMPYADWARSVTATPAALMGLDAGVIRKGAPANLILFRDRGMTEFLSRPQAHRLVLRNGKAIDSTLPDYRELDGLFVAEQTAA